MNDIQSLALLCAPELSGSPWKGLWGSSGNEVLPGFFTLHNDWAGQSKRVLHHRESGFVFKPDWGYTDPIPANSSKQYVGHVTFTENEHGNCQVGTYRVRLPEFLIIEVGDLTIQAMEYVEGVTCCGIRGGWCNHAYAMVQATNCEDAHNGNYLISNGEVVLFDFDGIEL